MKKVLIVATSKNTRGGITSVIKAHKTGAQWKKHHCKWIQTHRDGNLLRKLLYLCIAILEYIILLPFYDIVHIHLTAGNSAKRKKIFFKLAKYCKKKTILHFHPSGEQILNSSSNCTRLYNMFQKADLILVLSEHWKLILQNKLQITSNIKVLYNPCPNVNRRNDLRKEQILFAGTIIPRKGYTTLLKGFAIIASKYPKWKIIFAGNGEIKEAQNIARKLSIINQTIFTGWISGEEKEKVFQESSIYCLASDGEGFPMGVLDAWAYGIPCVVTPVGGIPDIIINNKNGLLFPINDFNSLAKQLEKLITNINLRENIVRESDKYVNGLFNIDNINKQLDTIYSTL